MTHSATSATPLPRNPSLDSLKKQAKALRRAWRAGEAEAQERVHRYHPRPDAFSSLRDAQLVIAREYGKAGWAELREAVEAANLEARPRAERIEAFLRGACINYQDDSPRYRRRAQHLLDADPSLGGENVYTAAVTADVEALRELSAAVPERALQPGGPYDWPPLMYLTYARLPKTQGDPVDAARVLLDAGADPNAGVRVFDAYLFTPLTGAMGEGEGGLENQPPHPQARALAELLLERGADPNESQGLYNTHFTPGNDWLELLLEHGLTAESGANWVDENDPIGTLDYQLGVAVTRGFTERVALLLANGADPNGVDFYDRRCHYENALLYGRPEIAEMLLANGATRIELSPASRFRAACMEGDADAARAMLATDPSLIDDDRLVHDAIQQGTDAAVLLILELGASLEAKGKHYSEAPLHQAAMQGRDAIVEALLARGARLDMRDPTFGGTPIGWANQGGHESLRERLLDRCEDVFDLAGWGRAEQLKALLATEPSLATRTRADGVTALHLLSVAGERGAEVIDLLLASGALIDARTDEGITPLAAAVEREDDDVAELLRERGAREE